MNTPFEDDVRAFAGAGFEAVEIWLTKLETFLQTRTIREARELFEGENLKPVAASAQGGLLLTRGAERREHWSHFERRLEILQALEIPTIILVPDFPSAPDLDDYSAAAESLALATETAAKYGARPALEFQKSARFCASLDTALALLEESSSNAGLCFDVFHYYTGPSKFEDLDRLDSKTSAWVQVCDLIGTPRELAGDSDRILPGDGDFRLDALLERFEVIGYDGYVSVEVLNPSLWAIAAERVADAAFQSLSRLLNRRRSPASGGR